LRLAKSTKKKKIDYLDFKYFKNLKNLRKNFEKIHVISNAKNLAFFSLSALSYPRPQ
jgi:hypothetical protein